MERDRFGMCDSLTATLGRPCPFWIGLVCAILFFGPLFFLLYAMWKISVCVRKGLMDHEEEDNVTWKETEESQNYIGKAESSSDLLQDQETQG